MMYLYSCTPTFGPGDDGEIPKKRFRDDFRLPDSPENNGVLVS